MPWVRIDETFPDHPKVFRLSDAAFRAHVVAICYASQYLTDGWIPAPGGPQKVADELVRAGVWERNGDGPGYRIHDYLDYQRSRAEVEELRKRRSEAGRRGALKRWQKP